MTISPWPRRRFRDRHNRGEHNRWRTVGAVCSKGAQLLFAQNYTKRPNHFLSSIPFRTHSDELIFVRRRRDARDTEAR